MNNKMNNLIFSGYSNIICTMWCAHNNFVWCFVEQNYTTGTTTWTKY